MEGSRPIVLEVQALVSESGYPTPKRSATGYELNRLTMLLALLERKLDLPFNQYDNGYINIAGGIKITEHRLIWPSLRPLLSLSQPSYQQRYNFYWGDLFDRRCPRYLQP